MSFDTCTLETITIIEIKIFGSTLQRFVVPLCHSPLSPLILRQSLFYFITISQFAFSRILQKQNCMFYILYCLASFTQHSGLEILLHYCLSQQLYHFYNLVGSYYMYISEFVQSFSTTNKAATSIPSGYISQMIYILHIV